MNDTPHETPSNGPDLTLQSVAYLPRIRTHITDAVSYWEPMRIIYNGVLGVLVFACWGLDIILSGPSQWLGAALVLMVFAVIANALYCLAYPVDLAFQMVPFTRKWKGFRWPLFAAGVMVASVLATWVMLGTGGMG